MNLLSLILYGAINLAMVLTCLGDKGKFYQFPFWAGTIALGWFFPQAIGGYTNASRYPVHAYSDGMFFAALCTVFLWVGFAMAQRKGVTYTSWICAPFDARKLFYAGAVLCMFGFFFQWKLWSLPEEMLSQTQWSGAPVKYLFLASVFQLGFITLWLLYLGQDRILAPKFLFFIIPCLLMFLDAAVLRGRRAGMMNLVSYLLVSLWFVRRIVVPRWFIVAGLTFGLVLINSIGTYRAIMKKKGQTLSEQLAEAANADYIQASKENIKHSGAEFENYIYYRMVHVDTGRYDYGLEHWNRFVFNYVPGQIVGRDFKESLYIEDAALDLVGLAKEMYGHSFKIGTTVPGYTDAFASFGWFGFVKFMLIGWMMGMLYNRAMHGAFLGQLLYIYFLTTGMQSISHGTNDILIRVWIYFFMLAYPVLYWAKARTRVDHEHYGYIGCA